MRRIRDCYIPAGRAEHFSGRALPEEVYEVLENQEFKPLWVRTKTFGKSPAYLVYGRPQEGRYHLIPGILLKDPPMDDIFMPVTVRPMSPSEQRYYERHRKGEPRGRG
ncbi:MAG: hypothetical protein AB1700_08435, partial [Bacillota bacterium]